MSTLLAITLALSTVSLLCTTFTLLRTWWPLLPSHPLSRTPQPEEKRKKRLKSAQR
jgi:hypothetical protein